MRAAAAVLVLLVACAGPADPTVTCPLTLQARDDTRVLVFSRTLGYRHESIAAGAAAIAQLGTDHNFAVSHTEDPATFSPQSLQQFDVIVFLSTTGDVLDDTQQAAFESFVRAGGGFVGIHAAADTEYDWPWYGGLVGARFRSHPAIQPATVHVLDASHLAMRCVPTTWSRTDEWYDFQDSPAASVTILATLDEATYDGGVTGDPHPIAWAHEYDGGRAWYTGMGHTSESFAEPAFLQHLLGAILWAAD